MFCRQIGICLCAVFCVLCFFSCSSRNRIEGYAYYRLNANPSTLDPALIVDVTGGLIAAKIFNGLVKIGDDLSIQPDIAESWTQSKDGLVYTFRIKKGVYFSNGREVRADDFAYSFKRLLDPKTLSPNTWVLDKIRGASDFKSGKSRNIDGIRVRDDYIIEIRLQRPFSPFLSLLTMTAAYVVPREETERWGKDFSSHPCGTGPFTMSEWLPDREIKLAGRDDYFAGKARVSGIIYRIIPEDLTAVTEFDLGNIDVLTIPAAEYTRYRTDPALKGRISSSEGLNTYYLGMNCSRPPFNNPDLRKAMNYAVDRDKILSTLYEKRGRPAVGPLPDLLRKWKIQPFYTHDLRKARDLIRNKDFAGRTVTFYVTADQEIVDIAEVIQSYLHAAGLNVQIIQLEWSAYKEAINRGEPDMFFLSWWADYPDPENFLFPLFHSSNHGPAGNRTRYTNPAVDSLIEQGQHMIDVKQRDICYRKAEEMIIEDAPWVFLWHRTDFTIRQSWIKNYRIYTVYSMDKGTEISF